ncbi:NAD-dependent epimerase/dehydratase family protein [Hyphomicrobiales bacterium]|nr:NAD-dependent epimerase/dehydratase family protein [Hyphomicrobiales bacterium]
MSNTFLVVGSTGLVGKKLLFELAEKGSEVIAITRRYISNLPENVSLLNINFDDFLENGSLPSCDHIYICLGTTIKKAGSQSEFKKVDFDYCLSFAKKAREVGATKISLISSVGASPYVNNFYLKTKGEIEEEIKKIDFQAINIFRPSLLLGRRDESRFLEKIGQNLSSFINPFLIGFLRKYRSVKASNVAYCMANYEQNRGIKYLYFDDILEASRKHSSEQS